MYHENSTVYDHPSTVQYSTVQYSTVLLMTIPELWSVRKRLDPNYLWLPAFEVENTEVHNWSVECIKV